VYAPVSWSSYSAVLVELFGRHGEQLGARFRIVAARRLCPSTRLPTGAGHKTEHRAIIDVLTDVERRADERGGGGPRPRRRTAGGLAGCRAVRSSGTAVVVAARTGRVWQTCGERWSTWLVFFRASAMVRVLRWVTARFRIFSQRTTAHEVRRVRGNHHRRCQHPPAIPPSSRTPRPPIAMPSRPTEHHSRTTTARRRRARKSLRPCPNGSPSASGHRRRVATVAPAQGQG